MALPATVSTQQPVEMQTLTQQPLVQDGQARDLRFMGHAPTMTGSLPVVDPNAAQLISENGDREARSRVLIVSLVLAVYVVVGALTNYALDIAAFEEVMNSFHNILNLHGETPPVALIVINGIPKLTISIGMSLLVPLCGYLGVKQNQQGMMGCFCCCNLLSCCCGLIGLLIMVTLMGASVVMAPGLEVWMERCDPMHCAPQGLNMTQKSHVVDCLAAGYWEEYKPRFTNHGHWYPHDCPKVFLSCKSWGSEGREAEPWNKHQIRSPKFPGGGGGWNPELPLPPRRLAWKQDLRREVLARQKSERYSRHQDELPMPKDPTNDCWPNEGLEKFHEARKLAPELLPKFIGLLFVRVALTVPVMVIGLLGFCWGKDMWTRLGQGYSHVTVQPALGYSTAPPPNEVQLTQHLMQNTPLATQQQQQQQQVSLPVVTGVTVQPSQEQHSALAA